MSKKNELVAAFDPSRSYNHRELSELADELLREDARSELCRDCGERGEETGYIEPMQQAVTDASGAPLVVGFPEFACANGHQWYQGEGAVRGIGGDKPILFEEHFISRRRREIYNCVSADTSCLHKEKGWVTEAELEPGDAILVFDAETGTTRWGPVFEVYRYKHNGALLHLHGQGLDSLVTEDHRWPVLVMDKLGLPTRFEVRPTHALAQKVSRRALLLGAPYEAPPHKVYSDAFVRLQAWNLTEGHVWGRDSGPRTAITQSHSRHPGNVGAIRADIAALGASFERRRHGANVSPSGYIRGEGLWCREALTPSGATQFVMSGTGLDPFLAVSGRLRAPSPGFYAELTGPQQREFNRVLMLGDGLQNGQVFSQYNQDRMDSAAAAFTLGGHATSRTQCGNHMVIANWNGTRGGKKWLHQLHIERTTYAGDIWCPATETGFWVARRKGKTFVTGNSLGSPDPSIVSGIYNRAHPQGRKINSPEARARHGASYYR